MTEIVDKGECFHCGECCKRFYPEVTQHELWLIRKYVSKREWRDLQEHLVAESPYQKKKAFPDNLFIKPSCPLLTENGLCSVHDVCKPNSCQHWFCGRKSLDEPLAPARAIKFWIKGIRLLMKDGSIVDPTMTAHLETCAVAGISHKCLRKDTPADSAGDQNYVSFGTAGYKNFLDGLSEPPHAGTLGWAFPLTGVAKILASTWTYYFRVYKTGGAGHGNLAAEIRKNVGNRLRAVIIDVTVSGDTGVFPTSYGTVNGSYAISEYTVVDETDWLVCYWFAHCITPAGGKKAYIRYDDNALAEADQTRITNVSFQAALILRQLTENLYVQAVFSWSPRLWIRKLVQNLYVTSDVPTKVYGAIRAIRLNLSVIRDKFSFVYTPLIPVYKFIQNLSVISAVPIRTYNALRRIRLNLSAISDVFSSILTKAPFVRQFVETLIISVTLVRRYSGIRAFKQNLSAISEVFRRVARYIRKLREVVLIKAVLTRVKGVLRLLTQDLFLITDIFKKILTYRRLFRQEIIVRDVLKRVYAAVRTVRQNLSVIRDVFVRKYSALRKFIGEVVVRDVFSFVYTPIIKVYQFVQNLSVIAVKFTSTYTPLIPVYKFIQNLSTISVKLIRKVVYSRTIREDLGSLRDKFKRIVGKVRKFLEDLVVPTPND